MDIGFDEMPDTWGACADCGRDCAESDYNPVTRQSLCDRCTPNRERDDEDRFERALAYFGLTA